MTITKLIVLAGVCLVMCLAVGVVASPVHAQEGDQNLARRQGISGSLQTNAKKDEDGKDGPTKLQMAVGVGSIFVMIAVVKWA